MSDDGSTDSKGYENNSRSDSSDNSICRDFLRNVCRRGRRCKYRHPDSSETEELGKKVRYVFCHDYQNKECHRGNCKFLHCTREEEQQYRLYGRLPSHVADAISLGRGLPADAPTMKGEIPICKDFLKGECKRAGRCKFRHLAKSELEHQWGGNREQVCSYAKAKYDPDDYEPQAKRQAFDLYSLGPHFITKNGDNPVLAAVPFDYTLLEEENTLLRYRVQQLKKQVIELQATNEFILDQNAQLRLSKQTTVSPVTQALIPHTAAPMAPAITQISQQLSLGSNDLTVATTTLPAQRITELAAAAQQTISPIVPVTLGQAIAPVSIATVPVSIASVPASIAQALRPAVSLSQSLSQGLTQSIITMSGPSTPLVSYPIMTQSLRPVITHSLGH